MYLYEGLLKDECMSVARWNEILQVHMLVLDVLYTCMYVYEYVQVYVRRAPE